MIFKKGDKVFDHSYGWGEVADGYSGREYPIKVTFVGGRREWYSDKGKLIEHDLMPTLSFTEYVLEGFSQVKPDNPLPFKVGDVVYVSDNKDGVWSTDILKAINKKDYLPFESSYLIWKCLATENPLLFPDTKIYTKEDL